MRKKSENTFCFLKRKYLKELEGADGTLGRTAGPGCAAPGGDTGARVKCQAPPILPRNGGGGAGVWFNFLTEQSQRWLVWGKSNPVKVAIQYIKNVLKPGRTKRIISYPQRWPKYCPHYFTR